MVPTLPTLIPSFDETTRKCTDSYWLTIAEIPGSSVIIDNPSGKWKPCMHDILTKGVDVYIRLATTEENAVSKLNFINANFKNRFSGIYLDPCSEHAFTMTVAKSLGMKVAIDLSNCFVFDEYVKSADLITLYRGRLEDFDTNCGHYGVGPFCTNDRNEDVDALYQWSVNTENQLPKFVSMIFDVPASTFTAAVRSHYRIMGIVLERGGSNSNKFLRATRFTSMENNLFVWHDSRDSAEIHNFIKGKPLSLLYKL